VKVEFDEYWGTDTEDWKDMGGFWTTLKVMVRTSNRIFVGAPLCVDLPKLDKKEIC